MARKKWFSDQEERHARKEFLDGKASLPVITTPLAPDSRETGILKQAQELSGDSDIAQFRQCVARFYEGIGQSRISQQKAEKGMRVVVDLGRQGFSLAEIECAD